MDYPHNIIKVYGPYTRKKDGREIVRLKLNTGKIITKSYARYLKELELGKELDPNSETIDHKNRNHLDNTNENLQILNREQNAIKSALRRKDVVDNCVWCNVEFTLSTTQVRNRCRKKAGPFCSRSCSGKYGAEIKYKNIERFEENNIQVQYYRNDDKE